MSNRFRLYAGLVKDGKWFSHTEVEPLQGGVLAMLDGVDKSGAARLLNLIKGSVKKLYTEDGEEFLLRPEDYNNIYVVDSWKIGYEQIKLTTGQEKPIIPENFYCPRCSMQKLERFTEINENWEQLIEQGLIDEIFLKNSDATYDVELPDPIVIQSGRTIAGGTFHHMVRRPTTLGDMLKIHKDPIAMSNEAAMLYSLWDLSIINIEGLSERDLNIIRRAPGESFIKKYVATTQSNIDAMSDADYKNMLGIDASDRKVTCKYCGEQIGGYLDFTNFFSALLPKRSDRNPTRMIQKQSGIHV